MIERILVMCPTRTESLRWVEILRQQIKCARTPPSVSGSGLNLAAPGVAPNHPMPPPGLPPHVSLSNSPPFIMLTLWIRDAIEDGRLSLLDIKDLTKQSNFNTDDQNSQTLSPWQLRRYRNQVFFNNEYTDSCDLTENFKRDALNIDEDDNPFGYIRYMSSCSGDEITLLLPSPVVSDGSESEESEQNALSYSQESSVIDSDKKTKGTRNVLFIKVELKILYLQCDSCNEMKFFIPIFFVLIIPLSGHCKIMHT